MAPGLGSPWHWDGTETGHLASLRGPLSPGSQDHVATWLKYRIILVNATLVGFALHHFFFFLQMRGFVWEACSGTVTWGGGGEGQLGGEDSCSLLPFP